MKEELYQGIIHILNGGAFNTFYFKPEEKPKFDSILEQGMLNSLRIHDSYWSAQPTKKEYLLDIVPAIGPLDIDDIQKKLDQYTLPPFPKD